MYSTTIISVAAQEAAKNEEETKSKVSFSEDKHIKLREEKGVYEKEEISSEEEKKLSTRLNTLLEPSTSRSINIQLTYLRYYYKKFNELT